MRAQRHDTRGSGDDADWADPVDPGRQGRSARRTRGVVAALLALAYLAFSQDPASAATGGGAEAQPGPDTVVESRLLPRAIKPALRRTATETSPRQAFDEVRRLILAARSDGDPRPIGYATMLLERWPVERADTPIEALVLHATIAQRLHDFSAARILLDRVLRSDPANPQALLTRATVAQVLGDYSQARTDCLALRRAAIGHAEVCLAMVEAASGDSAGALRRLRLVTEQGGDKLLGWAHANAGDVHAMRGEWRAAITAYQSALGLEDDLTTRLALADAWLASDKPAQARATLSRSPASDAVLLRQWQAARRLPGEADRKLAGQLREQLAERFALQARRGDATHTREAAWYALEAGEQALALTLARSNWRTQREPIDLWLLARAATLSDDPVALAQVHEWIARTGLRDARVTQALGAS